LAYTAQRELSERAKASYGGRIGGGGASASNEAQEMIEDVRGQSAMLAAAHRLEPAAERDGWEVRYVVGGT